MSRLKGGPKRWRWLMKKQGLRKCRQVFKSAFSTTENIWQAKSNQFALGQDKKSCLEKKIRRTLEKSKILKTLPTRRCRNSISVRIPKRMFSSHSERTTAKKQRRCVCRYMDRTTLKRSGGRRGDERTRKPRATDGWRTPTVGCNDGRTNNRRKTGKKSRRYSRSFGCQQQEYQQAPNRFDQPPQPSNSVSRWCARWWHRKGKRSNIEKMFTSVEGNMKMRKRPQPSNNSSVRVKKVNFMQPTQVLNTHTHTHTHTTHTHEHGSTLDRIEKVMFRLLVVVATQMVAFRV